MMPALMLILLMPLHSTSILKLLQEFPQQEALQVTVSTRRTTPHTSKLTNWDNLVSIDWATHAA